MIRAGLVPDRLVPDRLPQVQTRFARSQRGVGFGLRGIAWGISDEIDVAGVITTPGLVSAPSKESGRSRRVALGRLIA
ncbi:MAG: hypothetical protein DWI02_10000 [Planctomycetota bacterium]|nr:MAG: hypothetical protein DWI02_10000 [Planctomycetota bacterium]